LPKQAASNCASGFGDAAQRHAVLLARDADRQRGAGLEHVFGTTSTIAGEHPDSAHGTL
jgi:hypothetical protein